MKETLHQFVKRQGIYIPDGELTKKFFKSSKAFLLKCPSPLDNDGNAKFSLYLHIIFKLISYWKISYKNTHFAFGTYKKNKDGSSIEFIAFVPLKLFENTTE